MSHPSRSAASSREAVAFDFDVVTDLRPIPIRPPAPAENDPQEKPAEKGREKAAAEQA